MSRFEGEVRKDYNSLLSNVDLHVEDRVRRLLLMQTLIGHAQNGHGLFSTEYPNATMDDVVLALGENPANIRRERQAIIDSIFEFTTEILLHPNYCGYVDYHGKKLLSLTLDPKLKDPAAVLKGIYLASLMDSFEWRSKTMAAYPNVQIGGGECVAVDLDEVRKHGITLDDLAEDEWSEENIRDLKEAGVILDKRVQASTNKIISAYVRHKRGKGTSDDLAVILAGRIYGLDAAVGVFLCDAIDTWDKYAESILPGGQDEYLGSLIKSHEDVISSKYPGFKLPSEQEITKFIYTIALYKDKSAISNSQRYFLQIDEDTSQSAIEGHLNYIQHKPYKPMKLGHINSGVYNTELYDLFERRFSNNY